MAFVSGYHGISLKFSITEIMFAEINAGRLGTYLAYLANMLTYEPLGVLFKIDIIIDDPVWTIVLAITV